jgi:Integrase core domain/Phage integrase family
MQVRVTSTNVKWVADITAIATQAGWFYFAGIVDIYSRRAIGYAMDTRQDEALVEKALEMALCTRRPRAGLLHPHLLRHTFACMRLVRYRDPFALKSLLGHTTLAMTNHYCEAVQEMEEVRADRVSVVDGLDMHALDVRRSGRPRRVQGAPSRSLGRAGAMS